MQLFYWLVLLTAAGVAIFAIQNSALLSHYGENLPMEI